MRATYKVTYDTTLYQYLYFLETELIICDCGDIHYFAPEMRDAIEHRLRANGWSLSTICKKVDTWVRHE